MGKGEGNKDGQQKKKSPSQEQCDQWKKKDTEVWNILFFVYYFWLCNDYIMILIFRKYFLSYSLTACQFLEQLNCVP
jgi:hypothetical protein